MNPSSPSLQLTKADMIAGFIIQLQDQHRSTVRTVLPIGTTSRLHFSNMTSTLRSIHPATREMKDFPAVLVQGGIFLGCRISRAVFQHISFVRSLAPIQNTATQAARFLLSALNLILVGEGQVVFFEEDVRSRYGAEKRRRRC